MRQAALATAHLHQWAMHFFQFFVFLLGPCHTLSNATQLGISVHLRCTGCQMLIHMSVLHKLAQAATISLPQTFAGA